MSSEEIMLQAVGVQGDAVGRDANGHPVFVPGALAGERVSGIVEDGRLDVFTLLSPSPERVEPGCPLFLDCGGCQLQHMSRAAQSDFKRQIILEALAREGIEAPVEATRTVPAGGRRRAALHARRNGGHVTVGFKARKSHRLVPVERCLVLTPGLEAMLPRLPDLARSLFSNAKSAPSLHVTETLTGFDIDISGVAGGASALRVDTRLDIAEQASKLDLARVSMSGEILYQARLPQVKFGRALVALPVAAFLQASAAAEAVMVELAVEGVGSAKKIVDLFCGLGAFSLPLAEHAPVDAYDLSKEAVASLRSSVGTASGLKPVQAEAQDLFRHPLPFDVLSRYDAVVFDPPRAGAAAQVDHIARSRVKKVVGVSCNPATFVRDAAILIKAGFSLTRVTPVDQFVHSAHVELVGVFER